MPVPSPVISAARRVFKADLTLDEVFFFESKKNQVSLLKLSDQHGARIQVLAKYFCWGDSRREERLLAGCGQGGLAVPSLLGRYRRVLFMEYLPGKNLRQLLAGGNCPHRLELLTSLGGWLASFHNLHLKHTQITTIKGDMRLQNFIFSRGRVFGVDFEESRRGHAVEDLGDLLAGLALSAPPPAAGELDATPEAEAFLEGYRSGGGILPGRFALLAAIKACSCRLRHYRERTDMAAGPDIPGKDGPTGER